MMELRDVSYKGILKNINIKLDNNLMFIKGANGAGKSTLLDCISGVNRDYTGSIKGNDSIIYMNQNLYFDNRLKVKDFVQFIMELNDVKDYYGVFMEYVDTFNVKDEYIGIWDKQLGMLSGGERAKIFFTTLSMRDRQRYIFDEPYAGGDEKGEGRLLLPGMMS